MQNAVIFLTCIKRPFAITTFVLSIFEWPLDTGFTIVDIDVCLPTTNSRRAIVSMNMLSTGKQLTEKLLNAMISLRQDKSKSDRIKISQFKKVLKINCWKK